MLGHTKTFGVPVQRAGIDACCNNQAIGKGWLFMLVKNLGQRGSIAW